MSVHPAMVTTALELPGFRITRNLGVVRGIVVRSRSIFGTVGARFQTLVGGDITLFTELCEKTRADAFTRMSEHATELGANAIVSFRYDANEIMQGVTEVLAYGTAVVVEKLRQQGGAAMARVTGIGGVFLRAKDPKGLAAWYAEHLGITLSPWGGAAFEWQDEVPAGTGTTAWNTFAENTDYFGPGKQAVMINYRVDDLDAVLETLRAAGAEVDENGMDESYGKFGWATDPEGNRFELWQPLADEQ